MPEWHQVKQCRGSPQARPANLQQKCKIALPRPGTYLTRKRSRRLCHSFQYRTEALSSGNSKPPAVPTSLFRLTFSWRIKFDAVIVHVDFQVPITPNLPGVSGVSNVSVIQHNLKWSLLEAMK